jgi:citrate lyase synthetase
MDTFENPVEVDRVELLSKLTTIYNETMVSWLKELKELEAKR